MIEYKQIIVGNVKPNGENYKALYEEYKNPHLIQNNNRDGTWTCDYCGHTDEWEGMSDVPCMQPVKACDSCGCGPICAGDCPGISGILNDNKIYVAGFDFGKRN